MRIGGQARYFTELKTPDDVERACMFSREQHPPLIVLGGGSNTVFADGVIEALIVRIAADRTRIGGNTVVVEAGKILATLLLECAAADLDLSPLTGIPGTVGGAIFGNAGQGPKGTWIGSFVTHVNAYVDGEWRAFTKEGCRFRYRESVFKDKIQDIRYKIQNSPPIIWEVSLHVPSRPKDEVLNEIEKLLRRRIETQPHQRTAGSCFKAIDGMPAWQLIDAAGCRGHRIGDIQVAEKHANFLLNTGKGTYSDCKALVQMIQKKMPRKLEVEMRFVEHDGTTAF